MKANLSRLGGQLGVGLCVAGFLLVFLGWNGAASNDLVVEQMPYLVSGGAAGICLVAVGVGMIVVQNQRADRVALQQSLDRLREALDHGGGNGRGSVVRSPDTAANGDVVLAGRASYHRPDCHLATARDDAAVLTVAEAVGRGLAPCRICEPESASPEDESASSAQPRPRRQLRAKQPCD